MNTLTEPIKEWAFYEPIKEHMKKVQSCRISISGCIEGQKENVAEALCDGFRNKLYVTYSEARVNELVSNLSLYERNIYQYPGKDLIFYQADIQGNKLLEDRLKVIKRLCSGAGLTVVTTFSALMTLIPDLNVFKRSIVTLEKNMTVNEELLKEKLISMGYVRNYQAETPGQFSVRGGIIDIFDLTEENPVRIELWGNEIESIRVFDSQSQRSLELLETISIFPASEIILDEEELELGLEAIEQESEKQAKIFFKEFKTEESARVRDSFKILKEDLTELGRLTNLDKYINYFYDKDNVKILPQLMQGGTIIVFDEPQRIKESAIGCFQEFTMSMTHRLEKGYVLPGQTGICLGWQQVMGRLETMDMPFISLSALDVNSLFAPDLQASVEAVSLPNYKGHFELLKKDLERYKRQGYKIALLSPSGTRAARLVEELIDNDLWAINSTDLHRTLVRGEITCMKGVLSRGFEYPMLKLVVISEGDIFEARVRKKRKIHKGTDIIKDFGSLKIGDYVVHESHGMGIYRGIEKLEIDKITKDYLKVEYADGGLLYILPSNLEVLQKYGAAGMDKKPKLNRLGGREWTKTKTKVRAQVDEIAKELVDLYAYRQFREGYSFGEDTLWQREFEEMFPFEETPDQLTAIEEIKKDMESPHIMDRLVCGDVGFGKTEVAIRAAFKAVTDSKQVAVLVPTTILAGQHYNTFVQRMKDFPVKIEMLTRFRTPSQQKKILEDLKKGLIDIIIGTHRLLSKDVVYKDLGLLVVDEEQRFGVTHKEKIKTLKEDVDVLTLTATPIPRTLHMSLAGIRDMSVLEEPPVDRLPIQTFVCEYNEEMVREAITREMQRGGQVYYVYNRIDSIAEMASVIRKLVPEANVEYAHGRMSERQLENIMVDFIAGDIDILVSTTIIETGLDIPNVNTIIIHDSDKYGLSQLYQLRGRVGRTNRTAYAFMMYRRDKMLKEVAEKRLETIREYTDLGSGYKIALRDMEIRGAGNLLGSRQHGHLEAVGYDLYCKMLNEAIANIKGNTIEQDFTTQIDMDVNAYLPVDYIINEEQKLDIYKRIASLESDNEIEDMKEELKDRFGKVPEPAINLLQITGIRNKAHKMYITGIKASGGEIKISFLKDAPLRVEGIPDVMMKLGKNFSLRGKGTPEFVYKYNETGITTLDGSKLLLQTSTMIDTIIEYMSENK